MRKLAPDHPRFRWKPGWSLIYAMPLALAASYVALVISTLLWCGVSGCGGGGYGRVKDPDTTLAILFLAAAVFPALPLASIRWAANWRTRLITASVCAAVIFLIGYQMIGP
jgi:hypothetical protein